MFPVSADISGLTGPFLASSLRIQKFRSWRLDFGRQLPSWCSGIGLVRSGLQAGFGAYCGFNPSASNCRLHSAGASRSRSTPIPRGKRPSTAALTRSGARNASEMVILTCRTLHFWRVAICSNVGHGARDDLVKPATTSGDSVDKTRSSFNACRANFISGNAERDEDLSGFPGRRFLPRD